MTAKWIDDPPFESAFADTPEMDESLHQNRARSRHDHALTQLSDIDVEPEMREYLTAMVDTYSSYRHNSYAERVFTLGTFLQLIRYDRLVIVTNDPAGWVMYVPGVWQSTQDPRALSSDGGKTYSLPGLQHVFISASAD